MTSGGANPSKQRSKVIQLLDNLTYTKGTHTMKFGIDFRRLTDHDDNVFGNQRAGQFNFNGTSDVGANIGDPYTQFLLGYPDYTVLATVNNPNMDGLGYAYAGFAQDDWKITPKLTLNFGFRYELHPPLKEIHYDTAAFDPNYVGDGFTGAVVVPNAQALTYTDADFASSIAPTPILTASQDHLPEKLRYTAYGDYGPRVGFAWRPFAKTVIRGGYGRFIESPLWLLARLRMERPRELCALLLQRLRPSQRSSAPLLPQSLPSRPLHPRRSQLLLRLPHPL